MVPGYSDTVHREASPLKRKNVSHLGSIYARNIIESCDCVAAIQTEKTASEILIPQWEDKQFADVGHSNQN